MIPASSIRDAVHEIGYRLSCSPAALSLVEALTIITERRLQSFDSGFRWICNQALGLVPADLAVILQVTAQKTRLLFRDLRYNELYYSFAGRCGHRAALHIVNHLFPLFLNLSPTL